MPCVKDQDLLLLHLTVYSRCMTSYVLVLILSASWQNQQNDYAPSEDSGQPGRPPSLIRVFACAQWVAKDPSFLHADSEDSDQTGRMPRLIWVSAGRICHFVGFVTRRLILLLWIHCSSFPQWLWQIRQIYNITWYYARYNKRHYHHLQHLHVQFSGQPWN